MNNSWTNTNEDSYKNDNSNIQNMSLIKKMRPTELNQYIGQNHLIGPETLLSNLLKSSTIPSMLLWGPPGCGKTSLVNVIVQENKKLSEHPIKLIELSAATASINDIKKAVVEAETSSKEGLRTIVFMDKIHKFNKLQQDIFLPHIEAGTFILIGASTENPSSSLNPALLSRCRIFVLKQLQKDDLVSILSKAIKLLDGKITTKTMKVKERNSKTIFLIEKEVVEWLAEVCNGDGRVALNGLEMAVQSKLSSNDKNIKRLHLTRNDIKNCLTTIQISNDKQSDNLYHMHSALHYCIIEDDDNAALYWLARIIATGEDCVYIAKRLVKIASEDINLDDDDDALSVAVHTMQACQMIGMPESDVLLAQCVIYLSRAEKSKEVLNALIKSKSLIENHKGPQPQIPFSLQNKGSDGNTIYERNSNKSHLPKGLENVNFF